MRDAFKNDIFIFSHLRTHAQLQEAGSLLLTDDGKIKSFEKFKFDIAKINGLYNENYLQAEYQFAVSSVQMGEKWQNLIDSDRYNLQYRTAQDDKVRISHQPLHGITLPANNPFWDKFYPPNGWRCRCNAVQVRASKYPATNEENAIKAGEIATTQLGKDNKNRLEIFRFNSGKQRRVFPPSHPYNKVKDAEKVKKIIVNMSKNDIRKVPDWKIIKKYKNGGVIREHYLIDHEAGDYKRIKKIAKFFAKKGSNVRILPKFHRSIDNPLYKEIYKDLEGTKFYGKCPDIKIDDKYYEHEGFVTDNHKNALKNMLNHGQKQSNNIIIDEPSLTENYMKRIINTRVIKDKQDIQEVWILKKDGEMYQIFKNTEAH